MILAAAVLFGAAFGAQAQYTPEAGDFSVEVQFNPFSNDFSTFGLDNMKLKGRYFFDTKNALRFGIGFGVNTDKKTTPVDGSVNPDERFDTYIKNRVGNFAIDLGYENHFFQNGRVNVYAGAGVGFALKSNVQTQEELDVEINAQGNPVDVLRKTSTHNNDSWNEFRVNLFSGVDFYVYKGLYVGAELGVKVGVKTFPGVYTKGGVDANTGKWDENLESPKKDDRSKSTALVLGTYVEPAVRLGWTF